ncbi:MAG: hypothetical protein U9Q33_05535 [Campylobacterota bacterium]|nr:hypothetical protein [Campylobacterota bacterium]
MLITSVASGISLDQEDDMLTAEKLVKILNVISKSANHQHHNGTITVQNEEYDYNDINHKGANFIIQMPLKK